MILVMEGRQRQIDPGALWTVQLDLEVSGSARETACQNHQQTKPGGMSRGSVVTSAFSSCRGPAAGSQDPEQASTATCDSSSRGLSTSSHLHMGLEGRIFVCIQVSVDAVGAGTVLEFVLQTKLVLNSLRSTCSASECWIKGVCYLQQLQSTVSRNQNC